ncbi:hypothetical protein LL11F49_25710 [Escherichia coli]
MCALMPLTLSRRERGPIECSVELGAGFRPLPVGEGISAHVALHVSSENAESSGSAAHND